MPDFKTEQDVDAFVASRAPGLGRLVLGLRLADGRLAGAEAALVRRWLRERPGPGEAGPPDDQPGVAVTSDNSSALLATAAGLFGVALLVGSAWLPAWR